jgi:hypothetical protein
MVIMSSKSGSTHTVLSLQEYRIAIATGNVTTMSSKIKAKTELKEFEKLLKLICLI